MSAAANVVVALVALLHVYFLALEMFLWDKPLGLRVFGQTKEAAAATKVLAANQGLYNGFLAAGLFWGLSLGPGGAGTKVFFLCRVLIAGLFGAATASRKILFVQAFRQHSDWPWSCSPEVRLHRHDKRQDQMDPAFILTSRLQPAGCRSMRTAGYVSFLARMSSMRFNLSS